MRQEIEHSNSVKHIRKLRGGWCLYFESGLFKDSLVTVNLWSLACCVFLFDFTKITCIAAQERSLHGELILPCVYLEFSPTSVFIIVNKSIANKRNFETSKGV